ncbi:LETM1 domain-containing protein 1 [Protopterus annectens]|uniref:LETM1 domain-containing protein 1 n=1 Tax=Protopterus annectens TaxID=7888 RepID=UPI001CFACA74|nr:LETM1 domain-containing protein 1 [Protopterus annectens]
MTPYPVRTLTPVIRNFLNMALSMVCCCISLQYGIMRSRIRAPISVPFLHLVRVNKPHLCSMSSKPQGRGFTSLITSKLKYISLQYETFLKRRFPRFYVLHTTFMKGVRSLFLDAKEVKRIKIMMAEQNLNLEQLPYRDMEKLRQFRRDIIKATPLVLISIPPFANYLVFVLMYLFPRQFLIRHFWTPAQHKDFMAIYHRMRAQVYPEIVSCLQKVAPTLQDRHLERQLSHLCTKVQMGVHPEMSELQAVRTLFSGPPLGMRRLETQHMKNLSRVFLLTPHLPSFLLLRRLQSHTAELQHLDHALSRLGVQNLSEEELRSACYVRGLDSTHIDATECRNWLKQWLQLSTVLKDSEASLLLHSMVLLSTNYLRSAKE